MTASVEIASSSLLRAWRREHGSEFWIQLVTTHPDIDAFEDAIAIPEESDDGIIARLTATVPKGYIALIDGARDATHLRLWADAVAARLERHGVSGTLSGARAASYPRWMNTPMNDPRLTAFLTWSYGAAHLDRQPVETGPLWKLDDITTRTVSEVCAAFATPAGDRIMITPGSFDLAIDDPADIAPMLTAAMSTHLGASVFCSSNRPPRARSARLSPSAQTVLQIIDLDQPWTGQLAELTTAMTAHPEILDHAFIRPSFTLSETWDNLHMALPTPHASPTDFRYQQHLTTSHVIDAHGLQVLTTAQVDGIRHPEHWRITDLGHERHLVSAVDLAPWYANPLPDPDTLAAARDDFADILLTPAAIAANPAPWPVA